MNEKPIENPQGEGKHDHKRVFCGGSWNLNARALRAACRGRGKPSFQGDFLGFRIIIGKVNNGESNSN